MADSIYKKPIAFAALATVVVLAGSIATMAYPMLRADMHPRVEGLKPLGALELAGRDVYQREGCGNCHTQTVRPLRSGRTVCVWQPTHPSRWYTSRPASASAGSGASPSTRGCMSARSMG